MTWIISLVTALLNLFLGHKTDVAKESGADEQALKDQSAALGEAEAAGAAGIGAAAQRLSEQPSADDPVGTTGPEHSDPNLHFRD